MALYTLANLEPYLEPMKCKSRTMWSAYHWEMKKKPLKIRPEIL